jgi:hypothetical protein
MAGDYTLRPRRFSPWLFACAQQSLGFGATRNKVGALAYGCEAWRFWPSKDRHPNVTVVPVGAPANRRHESPGA